MWVLLENIHIKKGTLYDGGCQPFSLTAHTNLVNISSKMEQWVYNIVWLKWLMGGDGHSSRCCRCCRWWVECAVGTLWNPPMHSANWQPSVCSLSQPQPHFCASMHCIERLTQILWFLGFQVSWCYQTCKSHDSPTADHSSCPHSSPNSGVFGSKCSPDSEQHSLSPSLSLCVCVLLNSTRTVTWLLAKTGGGRRKHPLNKCRNLISSYSKLKSNTMLDSTCFPFLFELEFIF